MGHLLKETLEIYLRSHIDVNNQALAMLEKEAEEQHIAIVKREVGQLLSVLVKIKRPERVLEIGTAIGYSTLWMVMELRQWGGGITTIERHPGRYERAKEVFGQEQVSSFVEPLLGDAGDIVPRLEGNFDLIFVDAAKGQYLNWFPNLRKLLNPGGILVADNVLYRGLVLPNTQFPRRKKTMVKRLRQYLKEIQKPPFTSVVLPLGDGVAISILEEESH